MANGGRTVSGANGHLGRNNAHGTLTNSDRTWPHSRLTRALATAADV